MKSWAGVILTAPEPLEGSAYSSAIMGTYLSVIFWLAGYKYTLAGRAAIYNQLSTIFIIVLARIFLKESFTFKKIIGLIFAIIGAILVTIAWIDLSKIFHRGWH